MPDPYDRKITDSLRQDLEDIKLKLAVMEKSHETFASSLLDKVHRLEFTPVQKIAFGLAGGVLVTFLGAVIKLVLK